MNSEEMEALVEEWHTTDTGKKLHEFLGWTWKQYAAWVQGFGSWTEPCDEEKCSGMHSWIKVPNETGWEFLIVHTWVMPSVAFDALMEALDD